jgi:peroxiredoxin
MNLKNLLIVAITLTVVSCNTKINKNEATQEASEKTNKMEKNNAPLDSLLNIKREASAQNASEEKKRIYAEGIEAVKNSGILENALNVGDKAPDFVLNNALNNPISLYDELKNGPVILTWYRGGWCPYCNITLQFLQNKLPEFQQAGATLIALTPELPDKSLSTSEKNELQFSVLSDVGNKVGKSYGVVFELTTDVASIYEDAFGMSDYNGDESYQLPLAATYIIDQNGIIKYAFLDADYRKRAEPNDLIEVLETLK